jgi:hypothetical protein
MANFVLTKVSPGIWKGKAGDSVTVDVRSENANATKMNSAAYAKKLLTKDESGNTAFEIASDGKKHSLNVQIVPPPQPDNWFIVEVGQDKTTQTLLSVTAGQPMGEVVIQPL